MATLTVNGRPYQYTDIHAYAETEGIDISRLPLSIKVLLENLLRHRGSPAVYDNAIRALASWSSDSLSEADIAFSSRPAL